MSVRPHFGLRQIFLFALPLALTEIAMIGELPVVNSGISRLENPELGLAGFGVALSIAWVIEAPIIMLLSAATARAVDQASFAVIRHYTLIWSAMLTGLAATVAFTPFGMLVLRGLLGVEREVAEAAQAALAIMLLPWAAAIAWRRIHQGVLIRHGQTRIIGYGVALRLFTVTTIVVIGVLLGGIAGITLGALALGSGVIVESASIWLYTRRIVREVLPSIAPTDDRPVASLRAFNAYYLPLAGTILCSTLSGPVMTAGLARTATGTQSLAVWSVAYSLVLLVASSLTGLQQVAVRFGVQCETARLTRQFLLGWGVAISGLLVVSNVVGVTHWMLAVVIGAPASTIQPAVQVIWLLAPLPLLLAYRALSRGVLITTGRTARIQGAVLINLIVLTGVVIFGGGLLPESGPLLGAVAMLLAMTTEAAYLAYCVQHSHDFACGTHRVAETSVTTKIRE